MKRIIGALFVLSLLAVGLASGYLYLYSRTPYGDHFKEVHIRRGAPLKSILATLEQDGIISDAEIFRIYLIMQGLAVSVRAGDYEFHPKMTPKEVARELVTGDFKTYRFTIPEGWNMEQIANFLERSQLAKYDDFMSWAQNKAWVAGLDIGQESLEGYLFPSTYETYYPKDARDLIKLMIKAFHQNFSDEMKARAQQVGMSPHEVVTLASIVEKETGKPEERPLIASVFDNRLRIKMPLQSDPTVIYGIKDYDGNITRRHLETYTPYNTYTIPGLPPGPIASPGKSALLAVLYPAETEYLYFVSKNNGSHVFAKTLQEHNQNVYKYQIKREQP